MAGRRFISVGLLASFFLALAGPAKAQDTVFWSSYGADEVRSAAVDGTGTVTSLYTGQTDAAGIDLDDNRLVWAVRAADSINAGPLDGSVPATTLASGLPGELTGLTLDHDADRAIFGNKTTDLRTVSLGGGPSTVLYGGLDNTLAVTADTANGRVYFNSNGGLGAAPLDGSGPIDNLQGPGVLYGGVAVDSDGGFVYWTEEGTGNIRRTRTDGSGTAQTLYSGQSAPEGIAVDSAEGFIYWASYTAGALRRAPLDGSGPVETLRNTPTPYYLVLRRPPFNEAPPTVTGTPGVGSQLMCDQGDWAETVPGSYVYRPAVTGYGYQWRKNGSDIPGAAASTFTPTEAGEYSCAVTATNAAGAGEPGISDPVSVTAAAPPAPPANNPVPAQTRPNKKCKRLEKKLKRWQARKLALARTGEKRAYIQANIKDTKRRLKRLGC